MYSPRKKTQADVLCAAEHDATAAGARMYDLRMKAEEIGAPGNIKLAKYVLKLERRIDALAEQLMTIRSLS